MGEFSSASRWSVRHKAQTSKKSSAASGEHRADDDWVSAFTLARLFLWALIWTVNSGEVAIAEACDYQLSLLGELM
jgi:hypothetical protein